MPSVEPASIAASIVAMQSASLGQSIATAVTKQQADAQASVVDMLSAALESAASPPAPPGQGLQVDIRA